MEKKNSWSLNDDNLLAEVVLAHIKNGVTQIKAFEAAAKKLGRTTGACAFRWNSTIRKKFSDTIINIKNNKQTSTNLFETQGQTQQEDGKSTTLIEEISDYVNELENKIEQLQIEIKQLREQANHNKEKYLANDDFQKLISIITNARDKGFLNRAN